MGYPWPNQIRVGDRITAADITLLRNQIKHQGDLAGLNPPITWSPSTISPGSRILASHFRDMRAAIQRLWNSKNRGPLPMWSSGVRPGGPSENTPPTSIRATDITDLRHWLDLYIDNHPRTGMDTKGHDASAVNRPSVDDNQPHPWIANIRGLMPPTPSQFMVRCKVVAPVTYPNAPQTQGSHPIPWSDTDRDNYRDAFSDILNKAGAVVYAVLTREFVRYEANPDAIVEPLNSNFSNAFISTFASQAATFASRILSAGVQTYIIWNEPNGEQGGLIPASKFAALVYNCYLSLKAVSSEIRVYWGGLLMAPNSLDADKVQQGEIDYVNEIYESLANFRINGVRVPVMLQGSEISAKGPWPWDGINFHIHRIRTRAYLDDFREKILIEIVHDERGNNPITTLVGECGITQEQFDPPDNVRLTSTNPSDPGILQLLAEYFDQICYFSHHVHVETEVDEQGHVIVNTWGVQRWREDPPSSFTNRSITGRTFVSDVNQNEDFWDHLEKSFEILTPGSA